MTAPARHLVLLGLVALALLAMPATAAARCAEPVPIQQAVATADAVIVGTVVSTEAQGVVANVLVTEIWRGPDVGVSDAVAADAPFDPASLVAPVGVALVVAVALLGVGLLARGRQVG